MPGNLASIVYLSCSPAIKTGYKLPLNMFMSMQVARNNSQNVQPAPSNVLINHDYPAGQLQAAMAAAERATQATAPINSQEKSQHQASKDAAQKAAALRIRKWTDVMHGLATGAVTVGSRAPLKDMPVWATPEVAKGGFATGRAAAGGELLPHEVALAQAAGVQEDRGSLAAFYMSDAGLSHLRGMLESGGYKVNPFLLFVLVLPNVVSS